MYGVQILGLQILKSGFEASVPVTLDKSLGAVAAGVTLEVKEAKGIHGSAKGFRVARGVKQIGDGQQYWLQIANFGRSKIPLRSNQKLAELSVVENAIPIREVTEIEKEKFGPKQLKNLCEIMTT